MAAGDEDRGPLGRADVRSLTEMASRVTGDSGRGVAEAVAAAAAGKQKVTSLS